MKRTIAALPALVAGRIVVMMMLVSALPAFAQSTSPCAADIKEYCGRESPGGGRLLRCYEEHKDKMSAGCRAWAENAKTHATVVKEACSKTIDARCNFEKGDPLAMLECLQSNYIELEVPCREKLNLFKGMYPMPVK
jgi:hypothetical protein